MESNGVTEDLGTKAEGVEDGKSSEEENPETLSGFGEAHQSVGYIIWFANAIELYQKKNQNCLGCGSPDQIVKDYPEDLNKTARKRLV